MPIFFGHEDKNARPEARGMAQRHGEIRNRIRPHGVD